MKHPRRQRRWLEPLAFGLGAVTATAVAAQSAVNAEAERAQTQQHLQAEFAAENIFMVRFPNLEAARKAAITFHANLLEARYDEGYLVMELDAAEIAALQGFGFRLARADAFIAQRRAFLQEAQRRSVEASATGGSSSVFAIPGYSCYETVEETFAAAQGFTVTYPSLATWTDVGNSWQKSVGQSGWDIYVLKLTNSAVAGPKPKLFVNSAIHAREYTTAPLNLSFARWLLEGYGNNADATWILDHHEVHLMLQTNPDGRKKAETGLSWRKNTNQAYCGATSNNRGADLNRNFSFAWNSTNGQGSSGNPCDATYHGASAASEPETQAIEGYVRSLWPDLRGPAKTDAAPTDTSGIHIDVHSYSQLVLWPWGDTATPAPNGTALQTLGRKFAFFNNYTPQQSIGLYPTDGTSDNVSYGELGVPAYTFELGTSFFQSCSTYESTIKPNNLPALIYAAKVVRTPYVTPAGPDITAVSLASGTVPAGTPATLNATASDARFNNSNGTEPTQAVAAAEYYVDTPPWAGGTPQPMSATDGSFNATTEGVTASIDTTGLANGKHLVFVRARDAGGAWGAPSAVFLTIGTGGGTTTIPEVESNNTRSTAQSITAPLPVTVAGSSSSGNEDFFAVTVPAGSTLRAVLTPPATANYDLYLYRNVSGSFSASSTNGTGAVDTASLRNTGTASTTFYVRVRYRSGGTGNYTLGLSLE